MTSHHSLLILCLAGTTALTATGCDSLRALLASDSSVVAHDVIPKPRPSPRVLLGQVSTLAGSGEEGLRDGVGGQASFVNPGAIAIDDEDVLYVVDDNQAIRRITPDGSVTTILDRVRLSSELGLTPEQYSFQYVGAGPSKRIYFTANRGNGTHLFSFDGSLLKQIGSHLSTGLFVVDGQDEVLTHADGNIVRIDEAGNRQLVTKPAVATGGGSSGAINDDPPRMFDDRILTPRSMARMDEDLWVIDQEGNSQLRIKKVSNGIVTTFATTTVSTLCVRADGAVFTLGTDPKTNAAGLVTFDNLGNPVQFAGDFTSECTLEWLSGIDNTIPPLPATCKKFADGTGKEARFYVPSGIVAGSDGTLYISDMGNRRIRKVI